MMTADLTDADLAALLAEGAGRLLMELRASGQFSGRTLGIVADKVANAFILTALRDLRGADPILSEESPDEKKRLASERVWIVDPLDGTREYVEGREDFAVHVALAVGGVPRLGAVALPAKGRVYRSDACPLPPASDRPRPLMLVSRTRPPAEVEAIADRLGADLVGMGSAGAKAMAVVAGEADLYYHAGGQHEWDNCAPAAVALGAGLHATRLDGSPLAYNRDDALVPDLVIGRPELAAQVLLYCRK
jgi:3'(2'), 5'-bisphosphate nucleotidase